MSGALSEDAVGNERVEDRVAGGIVAQCRSAIIHARRVGREPECAVVSGQVRRAARNPLVWISEG